jgi:hypothetical protein
VVTTNREKRLAWAQKAFHRKHVDALTQPYVDSITSCTWLTWGGLFHEMEGTKLQKLQKINYKGWRC